MTDTYTDQTNLVEDMERRLDYTLNTLKRCVPQMILCHVLGLDISVYNKDKNTSDSAEMQQVINEGLLLVNAATNSINMNAKVN